MSGRNLYSRRVGLGTHFDRRGVFPGGEGGDIEWLRAANEDSKFELDIFSLVK